MIVNLDVCATTGSVDNCKASSIVIIEVLLVPFSMTLKFRFTLCFTAQAIISISFGMRSSDIGMVVFFVWPLKSLRSRDVALAQKRLCTTEVYHVSMSTSMFAFCCLSCCQSDCLAFFL